MTSRRFPIAALLWGSGLCALIYQVVWLRELRLVFGASTPANAAVLAVFMGGLGYGALLLGKRADRARRPLLLYAWLELGISLSAALSPLLLDAVRAAYVGLGGSVGLGIWAGTGVRLLLAAIVLLPPTLLMGGTLPAAARAATPENDRARTDTALLYGSNTFGAVLGVVVSTFFLLEQFGIRLTLYIACALNLIVVIAARQLDPWLARIEKRARKQAPAVVVVEGQTLETTLETESVRRPRPLEDTLSRTMESHDEEREQTAQAKALSPFVLTAAAGVGFAFLLMELVWYRVLSPLLGGSSYTFGLILAVALAGIALGGALYARRAPSVSLSLFALTCGLEALFITIPYALGDRVALFALVLRDAGVWGLWGHAAGWTVVTTLVVFPAALVSGYQFPLLIALLGRGREELARHVGVAYAFNTGGAILGSLAGGFVLFPRIGALGAWRLTAWLLMLLGAVALWLHAQVQDPEDEEARPSRIDPPSRRQLILPGLVIALTLPLLHLTLGPTAVWRHSPIGAGRADDYIADGTMNGLREELHDRRRGITWQADGRESTVGLYTLNDTAFLVNGKSDGSAVMDGGTQVMGGLLGALLQPRQPKRALVIGLGTGSTAGWLAALPDIEQVDVVELEPAILDVARICAPVNRHVLDNPKVNVIVGDAREVLLTTPERYDLVFSEPSNPYRAGIASLFTHEFYRAVNDRLADDGVFIQWLQTYEIDARSVRIVYTTLSSVFPAVETWRTKSSDMVLLSRKSAVPLDVATLRERIETDPYREALLKAWKATRAEDVIARFVARPSLATAIATAEGSDGINTDDKNQLEFSIARALGRPHTFGVHEVLDLASSMRAAHPVLAEGSDYDDAMRADGFISMAMAGALTPSPPGHIEEGPGVKQRRFAHQSWIDQDYEGAIAHWKAQPLAPTKPTELLVVGDSYAVEGKEAEAKPLIAQLATLLPIEAKLVEARMHWAARRYGPCWTALEEAMLALRTDPWVDGKLLNRAMALIVPLAQLDESLVPAMREALAEDLAVSTMRYLREDILIDLAILVDDHEGCARAHDVFEPWVPWNDDFLQRRLDCYEKARDPRAARARTELEAFRRDAGSSFRDGVATD